MLRGCIYHLETKRNSGKEVWKKDNNYKFKCSGLLRATNFHRFEGALCSGSSRPKNVVQLNAEGGGTMVLPSGGKYVAVGAFNV